MVKFIIDDKNKVVDFIETTFEVFTDKDKPKEPEAKVGKSNVLYFNRQTNKLEWRQEDRPLTVEEKLALVENKAESALKGVAELYEGGA